MEKKQTKEIVKIIILSVFILIFSLSIIFTRPITKWIDKVLSKISVEIGEDDLLVHFINVGQGDAIAIKFPNNKIMLIDSGPKDSQNSLIAYIKDEVLKGNKDTTIDYLLLTHSDLDHIGGASAIFSEFEVKQFFRPNIACASEALGNFWLKNEEAEYNAVIQQSSKESDLVTTILKGYITFSVGETLVQIFSPLNIYDTTNAMSAVTKITYSDKSFLFTGDIQEDAEQDMVDIYGKMLDCDVLKVAHHGSKTSTIKSFLDIATPKYAVISVGENSYGHPHYSTVSKLESIGAKVFTTKDQAVRIVCAGGQLKVLEEVDIYSSTFISWWVIALVIIIGLMINLLVIVIKHVKKLKEDSKEEA